MSIADASRGPAAGVQGLGSSSPELSYDHDEGQVYSCITSIDMMPPFLMCLFSADDHWMFVGSNGALTCGRQTADQALFPYVPSDVLLSAAAAAGPQTLIWIRDCPKPVLWTPFVSDRSGFEIVRVVRKNLFASRIQFEEENRTLGLRFSYEWLLSQRFGFVRRVRLENTGSDVRNLTICDGLQNLLPTGLSETFQRRFSNLADAYKLSEVLPGSDLALFSLNSLPSDRPEPSESLRCTAVWSYGTGSAKTLVSQRQIAAFRRDEPIRSERVARGVPGSFLKVWDAVLASGETVRWGVVADVNLDTAAVHDLRDALAETRDKEAAVVEEGNNTDAELRRYAAAADGLTSGRNERQAHRHLANTLLNVMRGGVPVSGYQVPVPSFRQHLRQRSPACEARNRVALSQLGDVIDRQFMLNWCGDQGDPDLERIATEYLPLCLSRRHGDPSRPWNAFRIPGRLHHGGRTVAYEGNWRDLFQNWEALAVSYPAFLQAMVLRFVNASTVDGHNPYRIHTHGVDWERPDADDPWATIGYWGDHQIVYLFRLFARYHETFPEQCRADLVTRRCVYTDVPYRLQGYAEMLANPCETVVFDRHRDRQLADRCQTEGSDAVLARDHPGNIHRVTLFEKLVLTALVKVANYIPDAGIWLNTQRPEWNDALNAIVGKSASVVTACHLKLYLECLRDVVAQSGCETWTLSREVAEFLLEVRAVFTERASDRLTRHCPVARRTTMDALQRAAETYRQSVYRGFSGRFVEVSTETLNDLFTPVLDHLGLTIRSNRRSDGMFNTYNWVRIADNGIEVTAMDLMLEGQVAVIESGVLTAEGVLALLGALRRSALYRWDQMSYMLYPNREVESFIGKNRLPDRGAVPAELLAKVVRAGSDRLLQQSRSGEVHFAGHLRNAADLAREVDRWNQAEEAEPLTQAERQTLLQLWEDVFHHQYFTGRATTFFGYEGLGSIYWHMVSKLVLAVARYLQSGTIDDPQTREKLIACFQEVNGGIWQKKSVERYGGFPSDPYSHTPADAGVQQPGMTGQVKEDILTRYCEYGIQVRSGRICFSAPLLRPEEYAETGGEFQFQDVAGNDCTIPVEPDSFVFTFCQVPIIYMLGRHGRGLRVTSRDGGVVVRNRMELTREESAAIFHRSGEILRIDVGVEPGS